jgi:hypothetical protein
MANSQMYGAKGTKVTATSTGNFFAIQAIQDSTVEVVVNWTNAGATETIDLLAGQTIYGVFTSVTLDTGYVVAYE